MITNKVTFAAIAAMAVALSLAVVPALTNQAFAAFPNEGRGHETQTTCTHENTGSTSDGECSGQSWKSPQKDETTTTTAGKSNNVKVRETDPRD